MSKFWLSIIFFRCPWCIKYINILEHKIFRKLNIKISTNRSDFMLLRGLILKTLPIILSFILLLAVCGTLSSQLCRRVFNDMIVKPLKLGLIDVYYNVGIVFSSPLYANQVKVPSRFNALSSLHWFESGVENNLITVFKLIEDLICLIDSSRVCENH